MNFESIIDLRCENGTFRIGEHHLNRGVPFLQIPADPADRAARAHARYEGVNVAIHLTPDFWPGGLIVGLRIGVVRELVDVERIGVGGGKSGRNFLVVLRMSFGHIAPGEVHVSTHCPEV